MTSKGTGLAVLKANARQRAIQALRDDYKIKEGTNIYAVRRGGSASGMTHYYTLLIGGTTAAGDSDLFNITYTAALAMDEKLIDRDGHRVIKLNGGGMDMGFYLVYNLSCVLFPGVERNGYLLNHRSI